MISFKEIRIQNFIVFSEAKVALDNQGLVIVEGRNKSNPAFDSNGSGKSSLLDAFLWCIWGQTLRGLKADEVVNRIIGKDCSVELSFEENGNLWRIQRTRKYKKLGNCVMLFNASGKEWNENEKVQEKIDALMGSDYKSFINSHIFSRTQVKSFSECTDSEKKGLLEKLYDLEKYSVLNQLAKKRVDALQKEEEAVEREMATLEVMKEREYRDLEGLLNKEKQHVIDLQKKIDQVEAVLDSRDSKGKKLESELLQLKEHLCLVEKGLASFLDEKTEGTTLEQEKLFLRDLRVKRDAIVKEQGTYTAEYKSLSNEMDALLREMQRIGDLCGTCPTCKQDIGDTHKDSCLNIYLQDYDEKEAKSLGIKSAIDKISGELSVVESGIKDHEKNIKTKEDVDATWQRKFNEAQRGLFSAQKNVSSKETDYAVFLSEEDTLKKTLGGLRAQAMEPSPFGHLILEKNEELNKISTSIINKACLRINLRDSSDYYRFWEKAYSRSGIPSYLLDGALPLLNKYVSHYSNLLSGGTLQIEFDNQSETKKGEVREKFEVRTVNTYGAGSYEGNSSGERQRVDLCVLFAIQKAAMSRSKSKFNVIFMDEIFDTMDASGIEQAIALLQEEAQTFPSIFVITHNNELGAYFENRLTVIKDTNGLSTISKN